ncbi:hypothetical protein LINGRAHAP2_LOCUS324 [Linum grandiflorum]
MPPFPHPDHVTLILLVILTVHVIPPVQASSSSSPPSDFKPLEALIRSGAMTALISQRTGVLADVPLPSNYSTVSASVIRLRTRRFHDLGTDASSLFVFPPGIIPYPFPPRIAIVFFNLGPELSPLYFRVPGYSIIAPVIGFSAYDAGANFSDPAVESLQFTFSSAAVGSILARVPRQSPAAIGAEGEMKCVKFIGGQGLVQLTNVTGDSICETEGSGRFTVVVPVREETEEEKAEVIRKVIVAAAGAMGAICLLVICVTSYKMVRSHRIEKMVGEAENGLAFDTTWIGRSKMPSASMVRTQPTLEHGYAP